MTSKEEGFSDLELWEGVVELECIRKGEVAHVVVDGLKVPVVHHSKDAQHVGKFADPPLEGVGLLVVVLDLPVFDAAAFLDMFQLSEGEC